LLIVFSNSDWSKSLKPALVALFLAFTLIALELILTDATAYYFLFCSSFIFFTTYKAIAVLFLVSFA
jgi:hypothetical protein